MRATRAYAVGVFPERCLGDVLQQAVRQLAHRRPGQRTTTEALVPLREGGGWVRITLTPTAARPRSVVCLLETLPRGSPERAGAAARSAGMTERELAVARLAIRGLGNREIARELGISSMTVKNHLAHVYRKAKVSGRTELGAFLLGASDTF